MPIAKTSNDIGQLIRSQRKALGWAQEDLAQQIGVSRQWVIDIEKGKPRVELALVLRALNALGLTLTIAPQSTIATSSDDTSSTMQIPRINIDAIVGKPTNFALQLAELMSAASDPKNTLKKMQAMERQRLVDSTVFANQMADSMNVASQGERAIEPTTALTQRPGKPSGKADPKKKHSRNRNQQ